MTDLTKEYFDERLTEQTAELKGYADARLNEQTGELQRYADAQTETLARMAQQEFATLAKRFDRIENLLISGTRSPYRTIGTGN